MTSATSRQRLFLASCIALIVTAMSFAIRADIMGSLESEFKLDKEELGWISGTAFWGFTVSMVVGGPLCDVLGMGRLLSLAFLGHLGGILLTVMAGGFNGLFFGTLLIGLANGMVEAACNPLIATVYPEEKTKKLNQFHVWFPGGIVIGGLLAFALTQLDLNWQWKMATMIPLTLVYGLLFLGKAFPATERVASGVSFGEMFSACIRPLFIIMVLCMFLTASTELGTNQWLPNILNVTAGISGILVLVWINGLMAVGRQFAGPIVHRLSPSGMLFASALVSSAGVFALSKATDGITAFGAATIFAIGICYFWPTMLGFVSERVPRSGALGLAIMGGAGMLSVSLVLPFMGRIYDENTSASLPEGADMAVLKEAAAGTPEATQLAEAQAAGGVATLGTMIWLPVILIVVFGMIYLRDRKQGGYRAEQI
ncbi:MAG: MFS transporter [Planctomycetota bacterium]|nr:MAG: MFS transporter [Planctomycetota bacterium]